MRRNRFVTKIAMISVFSMSEDGQFSSVDGDATRFDTSVEFNESCAEEEAKSRNTQKEFAKRESIFIERSIQTPGNFSMKTISKGMRTGRSIFAARSFRTNRTRRPRPTKTLKNALKMRYWRKKTKIL